MNLVHICQWFGRAARAIGRFGESEVGDPPGLRRSPLDGWRVVLTQRAELERQAQVLDTIIAEQERKIARLRLQLRARRAQELRKMRLPDIVPAMAVRNDESNRADAA